MVVADTVGIGDVVVVVNSLAVVDVDIAEVAGDDCTAVATKEGLGSAVYARHADVAEEEALVAHIEMLSVDRQVLWD